MDDERRVKIRLRDDDLERLKRYQEREGFKRSKAYGELIKAGLDAEEE